MLPSGGNGLAVSSLDMSLTTIKAGDIPLAMTVLLNGPVAPLALTFTVNLSLTESPTPRFEYSFINLTSEPPLKLLLDTNVVELALVP